MRVSSSVGGAFERGQGLVVGSGLGAGSGMLQWIGSRRAGNSGQTSRTRSHRLIT